MTISEAWVDFIAGWVSGGISVCVCQPVDTVLTRLQAGPALLGGVVANNNHTAAAPISVQTRGLVSQAGISALWRGSSAMISAVPLQNALLMGGYGIGKQWSQDHDTTSQGAGEEYNNNYKEYYMLISVFCGGCTGGVVQSFLMSPVELYKVHQQVNATTTATTATASALSSKAARHQIVKGLGSSKSSWRGLNATLLRDGIPHGVWFASYEWCKTILGQQQLLKDSTGAQFTVPLVSGAFAATVAWVS
jgi:solute carrier family 25 carnitine/acylcarnitine transporter 20/29